MSTSKVLLSVVAAAAAGVAIGTLLNSEKGQELIRRYGHLAEDWLNAQLKKGNFDSFLGETANPEEKYHQPGTSGHL